MKPKILYGYRFDFLCLEEDKPRFKKVVDFFILKLSSTFGWYDPKSVYVDSTPANGYQVTLNLCEVKKNHLESMFLGAISYKVSINNRLHTFDMRCHTLSSRRCEVENTLFSERQGAVVYKYYEKDELPEGFFKNSQPNNKAHYTNGSSK